MDRAFDEILARLARSRFRARFAIRGRELDYLRRLSPGKLQEHARDFIVRRLAPAAPANDGRQTPMKNHPVFVAQHATATCCRGCLSKWHGIPPGKELSAEQIDYVLRVIERWLVQSGELGWD